MRYVCVLIVGPWYRPAASSVDVVLAQHSAGKQVLSFTSTKVQTLTQKLEQTHKY